MSHTFNVNHCLLCLFESFNVYYQLASKDPALRQSESQTKKHTAFILFSDDVTHVSVESYCWAVRPVRIRQHLDSRVTEGHTLCSFQKPEGGFRPRQGRKGRRSTCATQTILSFNHGMFQSRTKYSFSKSAGKQRT